MRIPSGAGMTHQYKPQRPPFPKWYGIPPTTPLLLAHILTYKAESFYTGVHDWTCTTPASRQLNVIIRSNILDLLPSSISSMFLNESRFASEGITMIYLFLTHPNPSSSEKLPLAISDLTRLEMRLGESSINYMLRVRGISQRMQGITMERIIPLFATKSLDHDRYPGVNSCYLTGDTALVNCDLLELSGLLPSEETQQRALVIPSAHPSTTVSNCVSNTSTQLPPEGRPAPQSPQPPTQ